MNQFNAHPSQIRLARVMSSVRLVGPPFDEKLVRLVAHLFSPEEADIARRLPFYYPQSLRMISLRTLTAMEKLLPLLNSMADRKVILRTEGGFSLLPLIPGMFEHMLMDGVDTPWHREYARLLADVYTTGYVRDYGRVKLPAVKNIPVNVEVPGAGRVADSDAVAEMIEAHDDLAVANVCQCRQSIAFVDGTCYRSAPEDGCLIFGSFAAGTINGGSGRRVDRSEMTDIVAGRREKKLVFLTANITAENPNAICTCCDCCCHFLESVNHYGCGNLMAPPPRLARVDEGLCNNCGLCVKACNTAAHKLAEKKHTYSSGKCLGCGLCVPVCRKGAISMAAKPAYRPPARGFASLGISLAPKTAISGLRAILARRKPQETITGGARQ
ncbi:MAG TPA: 4Fe-4S binding protein [Spirochaetota bacterium]|nr:4Fe-4S binding protein [Spirochaetota bacterium]